jgi:hypothetical protein
VLIQRMGQVGNAVHVGPGEIVRQGRSLGQIRVREWGCVIVVDRIGADL